MTETLFQGRKKSIFVLLFRRRFECVYSIFGGDKMQKRSSSTQQKVELQKPKRGAVWSASKAAALRKSARRSTAGYCNCDCACK